MAPSVIVVGAGAGGLSAAIALAGRGVSVRVVERASRPGGKMRPIDVGGAQVDGGPTVFTMRWVFDELFGDGGASLEDYVEVERASILARHVWPARGPQTLDLHADVDAAADAIGDFAGPREARGYRRFVAHARRIFETVDEPFLRAPRPTLGTAIRLATRNPLAVFSGIDAHRTMHDALREHFTDPRLVQLFGRYATYVGSSPFDAPATLHVIAHVEQRGVWLVKGGMFALADGLARRAVELGATIDYGVEVAEILATGGRVRGVRLDGGEVLTADAVVFNGDVGALAENLLGADARRAVTVRGEPTLSAITVALAAEPEGFALERHNVFFSGDERAEFDDLFQRRRVPDAPTVYVCAPDAGVEPAPERSRLFALINAPPLRHGRLDGDPETWKTKVLTALERAGLRLSRATEPVVTTPMDFARMFPGSAGAIYGTATHRMTSAFARMGATTRLKGLYLAGGTVHPGAGVPMAARSGMLASSAILADLGATRRWLPAAISGFTSMS